MSISPYQEKDSIDRSISARRAKTSGRRSALSGGILIAGLTVIGVLLAAGVSPLQEPGLLHRESGHLPQAINVGVLIFREGLECVLVLAAISAGSEQTYQAAIATGVGVGVLATAVTWTVAVRILYGLGNHISALAIQAGTGLLAIIVLLVVMNWFFHKTYWTGWISLHTNHKRKLLQSEPLQSSKAKLWCGMAALGFTSFYREGFEVVLFLQSYRLKSGGRVVLDGLVVGGLCTVIGAVLTFLVQKHLPYRKMLIVTGVMLGVVLLVMVGEETQEMHWRGGCRPQISNGSLTRSRHGWGCGSLFSPTSRRY